MRERCLAGEILAGDRVVTAWQLLGPSHNIRLTSEPGMIPIAGSATLTLPRIQKPLIEFTLAVAGGSAWIDADQVLIR